MIKKLIKLFHKHKFKTLPPQDYFVNGIDTSSRGAIAYQESGQKIIKTCKCGLTIERKINVIRKYER